MFKPRKLAIIGLGHVGSAVLARAVACQLAAEIVCIVKPEVAHGEAVDAVHSLSCSLVPGMKKSAESIQVVLRGNGVIA